MKIVEEKLDKEELEPGSLNVHQGQEIQENEEEINDFQPLSIQVSGEKNGFLSKFLSSFLEILGHWKVYFALKLSEGLKSKSWQQLKKWILKNRECLAIYGFLAVVCAFLMQKRAVLNRLACFHFLLLLMYPKLSDKHFFFQVDKKHYS